MVYTWKPEVHALRWSTEFKRASRQRVVLHLSRTQHRLTASELINYLIAAAYIYADSLDKRTIVFFQVKHLVELMYFIILGTCEANPGRSCRLPEARQRSRGYAGL
jgi:hypothetical protein